MHGLWFSTDCFDYLLNHYNNKILLNKANFTVKIVNCTSEGFKRQFAFLHLPVILFNGAKLFDFLNFYRNDTKLIIEMRLLLFLICRVKGEELVVVK